MAALSWRQSCKSNLLNGSGERASARLLRYYFTAVQYRGR